MSHESGSSRESASSIIGESLATGIGGRRGIFDSTFPTAAFLIVYVASGSQLAVSIWAALGAGLVVVVLRTLRRESLRQVFTGFLGVAISAAVAARTGEAQDFFLPGLLVNAVYGSAFVISILIGHPLAGYAAGAVTGNISGWRKVPAARRAANIASGIWASIFGLRLAVQLPLYLAGAVGALGVTKIVMGVPLFLLAGLLSYRILRPAMAKASPMVPDREAAGDLEPESNSVTANAELDSATPAGIGEPASSKDPEITSDSSSPADTAETAEQEGRP